MYFGVDIGGTTVKIGAFSNDKLLEKWAIEVDYNNLDAMLDLITNSIKEKSQVVDGIGVGCPGFIKNGRVESSPNIPCLVNVNLVEEIKKRIDTRIGILNDANAAALGEAKYCGLSNCLFITLGTGVGGGLVVNGKVLEGAHGAFMEIGHLHNDDVYNFTCGCGHNGCVETLSSALGMINIAKSLKGKYETKLQKGFSVKDIFDLAKELDPLATACVDIFVDYLGKALANACILVDPGVVILGGGISNAGNYLLDKVCVAFKKYALDVIKDTRIILAALGNDAGIYGDYYLVKETGENE